MAIDKIQRKSGPRYQVKIRGTDGKWITKVFKSYGEAGKYEMTLKLRMSDGECISNATNQMTVDQYFVIWFEEVKGTATISWREDQAKKYRKYVSPVIGKYKLQAVTPALISKVLRLASESGLAPQTVLHIYSMVRLLFGNAVDLFQYLRVSPVLKKLRPKVPEKETAHLMVSQVIQLLNWVNGKNYDLAIWLGLYMGLRVGEVMALEWKHVDLDANVIHVRSSYSRKEKVIRDYPKGKKWHSHVIPSELLTKLQRAKGVAQSVFVAPSPSHSMLSYEGYYDALKRYCAEAGLPVIGTHGLRHSTSGIYMSHGANRDDMRKLFAHSSGAVTDRYVHDRGERVDQVAKVIRLFPQLAEAQEKPTDLQCSLNVPYFDETEVEQEDEVC